MQWGFWLSGHSVFLRFPTNAGHGNTRGTQWVFPPPRTCGEEGLGTMPSRAEPCRAQESSARAMAA